MNDNTIDFTGQVDPALVQELAQEMVQALNLDVTVDQIDPKAPLYGDGLGTRLDRHPRGGTGRIAQIRLPAARQ